LSAKLSCGVGCLTRSSPGARLPCRREDVAFAQLAAHLHAMIGATATLVGKIDARLVADATARKPQHSTFRAWLADEEIKIGSQGKSLGKEIKRHVGKVAMLPSGKFKLHLTKGTAGSTVQLVPV
jgi:hypothetical protein